MPYTNLTYSKRSLHGQIAHDLGVRIISGQFAPGEVIANESVLSADLKISRTVLREAIKVLAAKGLVESRPKVGTRVRRRDQWNLLDPDVLAWQLTTQPLGNFLRDLQEVRRMIEPQAAAFAAERASAAQIVRIADAFDGMVAAADDPEAMVEPDLAFHRSILAASGNDLLAPVGAVIATVLSISFRVSMQSPGAPRKTIPNHARVLEAIRIHDAAAARAAMEHLLADTNKDIDTVLGEGLVADAS